MSHRERIVVVGAGFGGLAAALRLASAGAEVTVLERHDAPGGKARAVPSAAGPVDAGPTVLTLRPVFEALFAEAGARLIDHVALAPLPILARHRWPDGTVLDLSPDPEASRAAVAAAFGARAGAEYAAYRADMARLLEAFEGPMMRRAAPSAPALAALVARRPGLWRAMAPGRTLAADLARRFAEPRLRQLLGRYATYVGGSPGEVPALLGLISEAEARGVWRVGGGLHALARAIEALARARGARFAYGAGAEAIEWRGGRPAAVRAGGLRHPADAVIFAGDPAALRAGALGPEACAALRPAGVAPRSHSAAVLAFAARVSGPTLAHHNVFFARDAEEEFAALAAGRVPREPTIYLCAQDGGAPGALGRFETIVNAPPLAPHSPPQEADHCLTLTLERLARFGVSFDPPPGPQALTTPAGFAALFPPDGALYGRSPRGMTAALRRPRAVTPLPGLYLAGGGTHPGAGVPMAALSGRHAAEAILGARTSRSTSRPAATAGGTPTASARTARARCR